jgi:hypothetical protein
LSFLYLWQGRLWGRFAWNCRLCRACRRLNRVRGRCYDLWGLCRLYGAYRAFWGRFWFWLCCRLWGRLLSRLRLWGYGSHRNHWLRLSANFLSSSHILCDNFIGAFNIIGPNYLLSLR